MKGNGVLGEENIGEGGRWDNGFVCILAQGGNYCAKWIQGTRGTVGSWGGREQLGSGLVPVPTG